MLVRGGRLQDCPGVQYRLVRGALDLVSADSSSGEALSNHSLSTLGEVLAGMLT